MIGRYVLVSRICARGRYATNGGFLFFVGEEGLGN